MPGAGARAADGTQDESIDSLLRRAQAESTAGAWMAYAARLSAAGRLAEAIELRRQLDEQLQDGPDRERLRLAQAGDRLDFGQLNVALQQFSDLAETATETSVRSAAAEQVSRIRQHQLDMVEYKQWQRLKAAAMRERIDTGPDRHSDRCQLCRSLLGLLTAGDPATDDAAVDSATAAAIGRYPDSVELHEMRALYLFRSPREREADLEAELTTLERLAPDSPVLREFATISGDDLAGHDGQVVARTRSLIETVFQGDPETGAAAVGDLRILAAEFPGNTEVRSAFALALTFIGRSTEAIEQAEWVVPRAGTSSDLHLTLGQVFWHGGDQVRAREHLRLAAEYAPSDADRADVETVRSSLGAQP